jgi:hypothetical protein
MLTISSRRALLSAAVLLIFAGCAAAMPQSSHPQTNTDCAACHACAKPTTTDPCLRSCPRPHTSPSDLKIGPNVVTLNELEYEYQPVIFEHRRHAQMSAMGKECSNCHHYSEAGGITACKECHPASAPEHLDQPGLKGAYHRQCMGCHDTWSGASDCEMCHVKKVTPGPSEVVGGPTTAEPHRILQPLEQPVKKVWQSTYGGGTVVTLHHTAHTEGYGIECATCHHAEGCGSCHQRSGTASTQIRHSEEALHAICNNCHAEMSCQQCHQKSEVPEFTHDRTGWPLNAAHAKLACRSCHGNPNHFTKPSPICTACHSNFVDGKFNHAETGLTLDENHREMGCNECHMNQNFAAKPNCSSCHGTDKTFPANVPGTYKR